MTCLSVVSAHRGGRWHVGTSQTSRVMGVWQLGHTAHSYHYNIIYYYIIIILLIIDLVLYHWLYYCIIDCHLCREDHRLQWPQNTTFTGSVSLTIKLQEILLPGPVNYIITILTKQQSFLPTSLFSLKFQQDGYTTTAVLLHTALTRWYCISNKYFLNWVFQLFRDAWQMQC